MRNVIFRVLIIVMLIGAFIGGVMSFLHHSKEFYVASSIAQEYAKQNNLTSDLTSVSANRGWIKRGDYNLSCFLFFPNGNNATRLILVRYTARVR